MSRFISYLFRFMLLFEINRFQILSISENAVKARVGWADDGSPDYCEDDEIQDIEWTIQKFENIEDAITLAEYLIDNHLMRSDKIIIEESELYERLGWGKNKYDTALSALLKIRVDMLDEGMKTDFFFIHF